MSSRWKVALQLLGHIWDIHFPKGKAYSDDQFRLLCRDSLVLADIFNEVEGLPPSELQKLGQAPAPSTASAPPPSAPAAEQTVEAAP